MYTYQKHTFRPVVGSAQSRVAVGITDGDASGALGSVGIDFSAWTDTAGATINNGAVFWMAPANANA